MDTNRPMDQEPIQMPDNELVNAITDALLNDERTKNAAIEVSNRGGIVTLGGHVKSQAVRNAAEEIAQRFDGVLTLINDTVVKARDDLDTPATITPFGKDTRF